MFRRSRFHNKRSTAFIYQQSSPQTYHFDHDKLLLRVMAQAESRNTNMQQVESSFVFGCRFDQQKIPVSCRKHTLPGHFVFHFLFVENEQMTSLLQCRAHYFIMGRLSVFPSANSQDNRRFETNQRRNERKLIMAVNTIMVQRYFIHSQHDFE